MSRFVQSLELRTLFAASTPLAQDLSAVNTDAKVVRGELTLVRITVLNDVKKIQSDLKGPSNSTNAKLLATLKADAVKSLATVTDAQASFLASVQAQAARTTADAKALSAHPSNTRLSARVAADVSKLNDTLATKSSTLQSAVSALLAKFNSEMLSISSANAGATPLSADVIGAETGVARSTGTYMVFANSFGADAGVLATNAGAIGSGS